MGGLRFMLDADTVSFALRGVHGIGAKIVEHHPSQLCVSSITLAELRFGADRKHSKKLHRLIDAFIEPIEVLTFDAAAAAGFGLVGAALAEDGTLIGQLDTLIAAHAVAASLVLVTNNTRHYARVRGLSTENWSA